MAEKAQQSFQPGKAAARQWQLKVERTTKVMKEAKNQCQPYSAVSVNDLSRKLSHAPSIPDASRRNHRSRLVQLCSGNLSAEFTQDLDKVALPACSVVDLSVFCPSQFGSSARTPFDFETSDSDSLRNFSCS